MGRVERLRQWMGIGLAVGLTGCSGFFPPLPTTPVNPGGNTGNSVYVANALTGSIAAFSIIAAVPAVPATGTTPAMPAVPAALKVLGNSPLSAGYLPLTMAVTPNNSFLYVGGLNGIYLYLLNSNRSLPAQGTNQTPVNAAALTVSPDGQWLIALDGRTQQLDIFQIDRSSGALTSVGAGQPPVYTPGPGVWQPTQVVVSPNGALIFAALGSAGDVVFTFNTSTGVAISSAALSAGNKSADNGLAIDPKSAYLYIARSGANGGVAVYSIGSGGSLNAVKGSPFAAGSGTYSVVLDSTGTYAYAANRTDGTISGFTIVPATTTASLTLTPLSGSPYASGTLVQSVAIDSTGKYLLAAAPGGNPDLTMYSFDTTVPGQLDQAATTNTDTDPAGASALAMTR